jgi:hypothetical protein
MPEGMQRHVPEAVQAGAATLGTLLALHLPELAVAVPMVSATAGALASELQRRLEDPADVLEAAGVSLKDLQDAIAKDASIATLWLSVIRGAMSSHERAQRRLLGRALANALTDDAEVDAELQVAQVAAGLSVVDIRVLALAESIPTDREEPASRGKFPMDGSTPMALTPNDVQRYEFLHRWPGVGAGIDGALGILVGRGLLAPRVSMDGALVAWGLTPFGSDMLTRLRSEQ